MKKLLAAFAGLFMLASVPASASDVVTLWVGGGKGFQNYAAAIAPYLGKHLPGNPKIVVKKMMGGGGSKMLNYLTSKARRDGTEIGIVNASAASAQAFKFKNVKYDVNQLNWLGSMDAWTEIYFITTKSSGIDSLDKLKAQGFKAGATGPNGGYYQFGIIIKNVFGIKNAQTIPGYKGTVGIVKAMKQNELNALATATIDTVKRVSNLNDYNFLINFHTKRSKAYPNTPTIYELVDKSDVPVMRLHNSYMEMARPLMAPPGLSAQKVKELRKAFDDTMKDPDFLANAKKRKVKINVTSGEDVQKLMARVTQGDPAIVKRALDLTKK